MKEHGRHLDRETAERLLDGASPTRGAGADKLAELLAAAGGPPRPYEYAREEEAVLAFRTAPAPVRLPSWRKLLTFKVLAITATVTIGGLAFASTTGIIPGPFDQSPGVSPTTGESSTEPGRSRASSAGTPSAQPSAAAAAYGGLCNAYLARDAEGRRRALETSAFADLVTAAGGADRVEAYCVELPEKEKQDKSRDPRPSHEPNAVPSHEPNPPGASRK